MISLEWVKDYIDINDQDLKELAHKITESGINVEKVVSNNIAGLVIGEVIECINHPDSDHLHICQVSLKDKIIQIVCGAPNIRKGLKVIVATPGTILPGNFEIKKSKIRGQESHGMICALFELGLEENNPENYAKGIYEMDAEAPVGENPIEYLGLDDTLYELDIHKHRNNDCYYHIGFAYEIGAILNRPVTLPNDNFQETKENITEQFNLEVETDKCPYYLAKMVRNVKIAESPDFIKKRLTAAGMRSINNVVDISNYVMLEFGQPLHFFDKEKLGNIIKVRNAKDEEEIITLDGQSRILKSNDIIITDGEKPICIAGVMGGVNTEVDENTTDILIEAAIFDPVSIRNTATRLDLKSEASIRYGKGLSYEYTNKAIKRACHLLEKYANAEILSGIVSHDKIDKKEVKVEFIKNDINKILGINISENDMKIELEKLDFQYELKKDLFIVTIPKRRLDIEPNVNDIAEEIGRLYGYNNLVSSLPKVPIRRGQYMGKVKYRKIVSKRLRSLGLNEVKTYTLISPEMANSFKYEDKKQVILPNPMSNDKSIVRTTLIPSLINVYEYNRAHGVTDISLYEIANTYDSNYNEEVKVCGLMSGNYNINTWQGSSKIDFYVLKGIVENLLDYMGYNSRYSFKKSTCSDFHPGIQANIILDGKSIGIIGKVHPRLNNEDIYIFELNLESISTKNAKIKYKEAYKYPSVIKDMAFIIDKSIPCDEIIKTIKKSSNKILQDITIFDIYEGVKIPHDKKSIAFSLLFNGITRTLTDEEVMKIFNEIINKVIITHNAKLRDN